MLATSCRPFLNRTLEPLARAVARTGIPPTALTLLAPILGTVICVWFMRTGAILPFCAAMTAAGCLDVLDGAVARVSGRVTKFGAYLDAVCDRYVDVLASVAAAYVTGYWFLMTVVLAGALLVSYAKARAAMEAPVSNLEWPDLMERGERSFLFMAGLAASVLAPWRPLGRDLFWWTLVVLAVTTHLTVLQRVLRARRLILTRS